MTDDTADLVLAERRGSVLLLTLNRPDRLNAWSNALEDRYFELLDQAEDDPEVRAIVVTGAGKGFCAGADMEDLAKAGGDDLPDMTRPRPRTFPFTVRKPMIAAINGAAAGLGLVEALYCDVRFCTPGAKLTTAFARRGLIAEYGLSWLLPRLIGWGSASDLLISARVVLGEEAQRIGLVERIVEPENLVDEAVAYAADIAENCAPSSIAVIKEQLRRDLDSDLAGAVERADGLMLESLTGKDVVEGVQSYLDRRPPHFAPLDPRS